MTFMFWAGLHLPILFADGTAVYLSTCSLCTGYLELQTHLTDVVNFLQAWSSKPNFQKSQVSLRCYNLEVNKFCSAIPSPWFKTAASFSSNSSSISLGEPPAGIALSSQSLKPPIPTKGLKFILQAICVLFQAFIIRFW